MFRFIHAADIHLDSPLRGLELPEEAPLEEIRAASRRALENLVELAVSKEVAFVVIAGDLYDGDWRDFHTGLFFNACMLKLKETGIRVFVVSGNHDAANQMTRTLQLPDNVHMFSSRKPKTEIIDAINVAVHGQSFANRAVSDNLSLEYPAAKSGYFNIGLLHTALSGREGHEPYAPCSIGDLSARGYQYWALGHVHNREEVSKDPWIVFPGNIQGRHIRETGAKGCTLVTVEDNIVSETEHIDLDVLRWQVRKVDLAGCSNIDEVYDQVQKGFEEALSEAEGRPMVVRLELTGATKAHQKLHSQAAHLADEFGAIAMNLGGSGLWLEKVKLRTKDHIDTAAPIDSDTPIGMLLGSLQSLAVDIEKLNEIDPELTTFINKLPSELCTGEDTFNPRDPEQLAEIIADVKDMLTARLISEGQIQ
ncbi:MAG: DNA repair exonuclease [Nitrospira sp.]|nr:DNA repair exonuclease [Nitrospira sp.]